MATRIDVDGPFPVCLDHINKVVSQCMMTSSNGSIKSLAETIMRIILLKYNKPIDNKNKDFSRIQSCSYSAYLMATEIGWVIF